jgi:hypothetical protein
MAEADEVNNIEDRLSRNREKIAITEELYQPQSDRTQQHITDHVKNLEDQIE